MMEKIPTQTGARDQLLSDLKTVISDAEAWLRHSGSLTGEELKVAKAKLERTLVKAKDDIIRLEEAVVEKTKVAAKATDEYVKENPWKAVGLGTAVGVVIGMLIARKYWASWRRQAVSERPWCPWSVRGWNWPPSNSRKTRAACSATSRGRCWRCSWRPARSCWPRYS